MTDVKEVIPQPTEQSYIELKLTNRGYYYWNIRLAFSESNTNPTSIITRLKIIDTELADKFPRNLSEMKGGSSFSSVGME